MATKIKVLTWTSLSAIWPRKSVSLTPGISPLKSGRSSILRLFPREMNPICKITKLLVKVQENRHNMRPINPRSKDKIEEIWQKDTKEVNTSKNQNSWSLNFSCNLSPNKVISLKPIPGWDRAKKCLNHSISTSSQIKLRPPISVRCKTINLHKAKWPQDNNSQQVLEYQPNTHLIVVSARVGQNTRGKNRKGLSMTLQSWQSSKNLSQWSEITAQNKTNSHNLSWQSRKLPHAHTPSEWSLTMVKDRPQQQLPHFATIAS